jgi:ADP-dependent NAD(P)H-hydrate dehydratase / NAD(P)H-hydrate epimerase
MTALYSVDQIRAIEQAALASLPTGTLMRRAGQAAAALAQGLMAATPKNPRVLLLAGPGNNGGDALETAACLAEAGLEPHVLRYAGAQPPSPDCVLALAHAQASRVILAEPSQLPALRLFDWALVIDGLFGIGLTRSLSGEVAAAVDYVNQLRCPVLALDVPSGLNADTGHVIGADSGSAGSVSSNAAIRATHTLTYIGDKPGLHTGAGRDHAGAVTVARLDIAPALFPATLTRLNRPALFADWLRPRVQNSHKGSYGDLIVIGGAHGMSGAPVLSARAALHCGAGRVLVGFLEPASPYDALHPELMCRRAQDLDFLDAALAIGPGLGSSRLAHDVLARALSSTMPLAIDADALNLLAAEPGLRHKLQHRRGAALLTPHPLEAARLLGVTAGAVQSDRLAAARTLAQQFNATVVLKGSGSIIATPDGSATINPTGNPALATAGTGDVLTGLCGALLAQGWPAAQAALAAVWLHGAAADRLVADGIGPVGLTASELIPAIRAAFNRAINEHLPQTGGS